MSVLLKILISIFASSILLACGKGDSNGPNHKSTQVESQAPGEFKEFEMSREACQLIKLIRPSSEEHISRDLRVPVASLKVLRAEWRPYMSGPYQCAAIIDTAKGIAECPVYKVYGWTDREYKMGDMMPLCRLK